MTMQRHILSCLLLSQPLFWRSYTFPCGSPVLDEIQIIFATIYVRIVYVAVIIHSNTQFQNISVSLK